MQINPDSSNSHYTIRGYQPGKLVINETTYHSSILLTPDKLITDWGPQQFSELKAEDLAIILTLKPELCLLGTGEHIQFPSTDLTQALITHKIGVEVMDTKAACRTFNLIAGEGRKVAAALLIA